MALDNPGEGSDLTRWGIGMFKYLQMMVGVVCRSCVMVHESRVVMLLMSWGYDGLKVDVVGFL